jgi:hypothetical protein
MKQELEKKSICPSECNVYILALCTHGKLVNDMLKALEQGSGSPCISPWATPPPLPARKSLIWK